MEDDEMSDVLVVAAFAGILFLVPFSIYIGIGWLAASTSAFF
jgi:hypothetical protein